jgi:predicted signal transduction protein with EAL and GGDEF domain
MTDPILISGILLLGLVFKFAGFAMRDELWLRVLVISGLSCDAIFYAVRAEPVPQSVAANLLLVTINLGLVLLIVTERTTWRMSDEDRTLYQSFPTLTPGQFFASFPTLTPGQFRTAEADHAPGDRERPARP